MTRDIVNAKRRKKRLDTKSNLWYNCTT
jgi:hypothetical protein